MQNEIRKQLKRSLFYMVAVEILVMCAFIILYITGEWAGNTEHIITLVLLGTATVLFSVILLLSQYRATRTALEMAAMISSARRQAEEQLREVVANISHDLKTPVTAIRGYSQGILDGVASSPGRMTKYVTIIRNKADDMSGLIDELSLFTQIYQGDLQCDFQLVNMERFLCDIFGELAPDLEMRNINLIYINSASKDVELMIDGDKLKRVVTNIVGNAAKYIDKEQGIVVVRVEETEEDYIVRVMDNGIGIANEEIPMIFDRFYRTDESRNSSTGGSGLGLSIAKKIITDHGGKIWAKSKNEKGTEISFSLPKYRRTEEAS